MQLFRNKGAGPALIALALIVFVIAVASTCRADEVLGADMRTPAEENGSFSERRGVRLDIETGFTVVRGRTPVIGFTANFLDVGAAAGRDFDLQVGLGIIGDYEYNGVQEANQLFAQALIVDGFGKLDLGLGLAYLQNTDQINGSNFNASLLAGYRFGKEDHFKLIWRHFSNAGTKMPNLGRDFVSFVLSF